MPIADSRGSSGVITAGLSVAASFGHPYAIIADSREVRIPKCPLRRFRLRTSARTAVLIEAAVALRQHEGLSMRSWRCREVTVVRAGWLVMTPSGCRGVDARGVVHEVA